MNAVAQTLCKAFPHVAAISTTTAKDQRDTTVWAAGFLDIDEANVPSSLRHPEAFNGFVLTEENFADLRARNGECVLTDDFAPVENLLAPVVVDLARRVGRQLVLEDPTLDPAHPIPLL